MCTKEAIQSAPSTFAALYSSSGILSIPASAKIHIKGIRTQESAIMHATMASIGLEKIGRGSDINLSFMRRSLKTPTLGLNIHLHIKPEITRGTAQENMVNDLKIPEPLVILDKSTAIIKPPQNVKLVAPPAYITVFCKLSQKRRSPKMYL